jgi:hypothetical protein
VKTIAVEGKTVLTGEMKKFCDNKKIKVIKDMTGPAGRRSQELLAKGEELLKESKLSAKFWGDAFQLANQIKNREKSEGTRSAWEKFDGRQSWKVEHKLGQKVEICFGDGDQGVFLGYAGQDGKTFKILRLRDKKVFVTESVKFEAKSKVKLKPGEDPTEELELLLKEETSEAVGDGAVRVDRSGGASGADGDTGAIRRTERERRPPNRLTLFASSRPVVRF